MRLKMVSAFCILTVMCGCVSDQRKIAFKGRYASYYQNDYKVHASGTMTVHALKIGFNRQGLYRELWQQGGFTNYLAHELSVVGFHTRIEGEGSQSEEYSLRCSLSDLKVRRGIYLPLGTVYKAHATFTCLLYRGSESIFERQYSVFGKGGRRHKFYAYDSTLMGEAFARISEHLALQLVPDIVAAVSQ